MFCVHLGMLLLRVLVFARMFSSLFTGPGENPYISQC